MPELDSERFFAADLAPEDLERILQKIDDNLTLRPLLQQSLSEETTEFTALPALPDTSDIPWRLSQMREWQAPLFLIRGSDPLNLLKRLLNLPLRLFGHKQLRFNRDLLDVLDAMILQWRAFGQFAERQNHLGQFIDRFEFELRSLNKRIKLVQEEKKGQIERWNQVAAAQDALVSEFRRLAENLEQISTDQRQRLSQLTSAQDIQGDLLVQCFNTQNELTQQFKQIVNEQQDQRDLLVRVAQEQNNQSQQIEDMTKKYENHWQALTEVATNGQLHDRQIAEVVDHFQIHEQQVAQLTNAQRIYDRKLDGLKAEQTDFSLWAERLKAAVEETTGRLSQLTDERKGQSQWLEQLAANQQGEHDWIDLIQRRLELLMQEVRESAGSVDNAASGLPVPHIVDTDAYQRRLADMGEQIKVNLGCGEKIWPDYINVDLRELREVDVVADVRRLPFEPGTLAELASAHLVEHFREYSLRNRILPYWRSLIRPGGLLRIVCPNWAAMLARLADGRMSPQDFKTVTFGTQDYAGNDHYSMYTPETLRSILVETGYQQIEVVTEDRMNGLCPEMEVLAHL